LVYLILLFMNLYLLDTELYKHMVPLNKPRIVAFEHLREYLTNLIR